VVLIAEGEGKAMERTAGLWTVPESSERAANEGKQVDYLILGI
jgi:hypothetical protein